MTVHPSAVLQFGEAILALSILINHLVTPAAATHRQCHQQGETQRDCHTHSRRAHFHQQAKAQRAFQTHSSSHKELKHTSKRGKAQRDVQSATADRETCIKASLANWVLPGVRMQQVSYCKRSGEARELTFGDCMWVSVLELKNQQGTDNLWRTSTLAPLDQVCNLQSKTVSTGLDTPLLMWLGSLVAWFIGEQVSSQVRLGATGVPD